jgi:hypothetical protein
LALASGMSVLILFQSLPQFLPHIVGAIVGAE